MYTVLNLFLTTNINGTHLFYREFYGPGWLETSGGLFLQLVGYSNYSIQAHTFHTLSSLLNFTRNISHTHHDRMFWPKKNILTEVGFEVSKEVNIKNIISSYVTGSPDQSSFINIQFNKISYAYVIKKCRNTKFLDSSSLNANIVCTSQICTAVMLIWRMAGIWKTPRRGDLQWHNGITKLGSILGNQCLLCCCF